MTPADLRAMIEAKATAPIVVDWLWLDLELLAPETPNAETSAKVQAKLDAWAYEFASAGGQIGWEQFRRLNEMSRAAFIKAGQRVRRESAWEISAALVANARQIGQAIGTEPYPDGFVPETPAVPAEPMPTVPPEPDPEPTVEDFTPIGAEPNANAPKQEPAVVGAALDSALDYVENLLRGEG